MEVPDRRAKLVGCQNCAYRLKSQNEAALLLQEVIKIAHIRTIRGGGMLMEARLTADTVLKLCLWDAGCEDCERSEEYGNTTEPDSQYEL